MNLLRVYVVVLIAGWLLWLALDKSPPPPLGQSPGVTAPPGPVGHPFALPPPERPTRNPTNLLPHEGTMLADFQYAVDTAKRGEFRRGFIVLWRRQYFWVAAIVTALVIFVLVPALRAVMPGKWRGRWTGGRHVKHHQRSGGRQR